MPITTASVPKRKRRLTRAAGCDCFRAENILLNQAPIIPLYTYVNAYLFRPQVKGIPLAANAMLMFNSVQVSP